jgi:hypothetical protein
MNRRKLTFADWMYYGSCVGMLGYCAYVVYSLRNEGTAKLRVLRGIRHVCESTAHTVGEWGMKAELMYNQIIERERMI